MVVGSNQKLGDSASRWAIILWAFIHRLLRAIGVRCSPSMTWFKLARRIDAAIHGKPLHPWIRIHHDWGASDMCLCSLFLSVLGPSTVARIEDLNCATSNSD